MIVRAWRIFKRKHSGTAFTGEGARIAGGRWNSVGVPMVYASQSVSLAALEMLVHLHSRPILGKYLVAGVRFDESMAEQLSSSQLPFDWQAIPAPLTLQELGDLWLTEQRSLALRVPSVIIPTEFNYLLNPVHPDFSRITIDTPTSFLFDRRLLK